MPQAETLLEKKINGTRYSIRQCGDSVWVIRDGTFWKEFSSVYSAHKAVLEDC